MANKRDYYEVLGISKSSSKDEIKAAYRKLALQFHPDRNKAADAETKFKEINEAYQVLGDEQKRKTYDQFGHNAFDQNGGMGGAGMGGNPFAGGFGQGPFTYSYSSTGGANPFAGFDFGGGDPFEIFESFFGGNPFGGRQPRKPRYSLNITFMEAAHGVEKTVEVEGKKRTIRIPAGADDGTRIRFDDFDITISVNPDKTFKREGNDLFVDLRIPFTLAILGGEIDVPTLDGKLTMKIRPGTQPNTMVRLREQGIQNIRGRGKGDEYVRLIVEMPEKLSKKQKQLLEQFAREK